MWTAAAIDALTWNSGSSPEIRSMYLGNNVRASPATATGARRSRRTANRMPGQASSAAASFENAVRPSSSRLAASAAAPTALANERSRIESEDIELLSPILSSSAPGKVRSAQRLPRVAEGVLKSRRLLLAAETGCAHAHDAWELSAPVLEFRQSWVGSRSRQRLLEKLRLHWCDSRL